MINTVHTYTHTNTHIHSHTHTYDKYVIYIIYIIYIKRIQEGINNPSRSISYVLSATKILKTYLQCFKYKIFFFKSTI